MFNIPGIELGYGFNWKTKTKHDWFQEIKVFYFYHRFVQHGISIYTDIGYRYKFSRELSAGVAFGAGVHAVNTGNSKIKTGRLMGNIKKIKALARSQAIAVISFGHGYINSSISKKCAKNFHNLSAIFTNTFC